MITSDTMLLIVLVIAITINILSVLYTYKKAHRAGVCKGCQDTIDTRVGEDLSDALTRIADGVERKNAIKESRLILDATKVKQEWVRLQIEEKKLHITPPSEEILDGLKEPKEP
jgi:cell division protein YceG involved in septum cleavage